MRPSRYRHRVDFQSRTATTDEWGGQVFIWADVATDVWCNVVPRRGLERESNLMLSRAEHEVATLRVYTRYRDDIEANMRIVWRGFLHEIVAPPIDIDGRGVELEIMAKALVNEA